LSQGGSGVVAGSLLAGVAVTHLHPGAGRSPGVVDLPVVKDSMGYPMVPASSVKGALKTRCARLVGAQLDDKGRIKCGGGGDGCGGGSLCCCLFGGEVEEGPKGAGAISILDLVPIAFPVASADKGFLYVAPRSLLARAAAVAEAVGSPYASLFSALAASPGEAAGVGLEGRAYLFTTPLKLERASLGGDAGRSLEALAKELEAVHPLAGGIRSRLVVLDDSLAVRIVDRGLLRVSRVRLKRDTKTVESGGLWTEEYIPQGTVFVSALIASGYTNEYCSKCSHCSEPSSCLQLALQRLQLQEGLPVFVGGKETMGKGLIVFKPL